MEGGLATSPVDGSGTEHCQEQITNLIIPILLINTGDLLLNQRDLGAGSVKILSEIIESLIALGDGHRIGSFELK
jgi:hypothetical protein